jgi:integrase
MDVTIKVQEAKRRPDGSGRLYKRPDSNFWWIQFYSQHGKQIRESTKTEDEKKAEKLLRKRIGEVAARVHNDSGSLRYEDVREVYYRDYEINGRRSLRRDREGKLRLDKVQRLDDFFARVKVSKIDTDLLRKYIAEQQKSGIADSTINRSLSALRRMLNIAKEDGKLRDIPHFPMLSEAGRVRKGFFEEADYRKLFAALPDYLQTPLALGYFTGMRKGEVLGLRWEQVDLLRGMIRLREGETKNGAGRTIPIVPQLAEELKSQHKRRQGDFPLVCFRFDRLGHAQQVGDFRKVWQARCVTLGLGKMEQIPDSETKIYRGKLFHDLRRAAVRNLVRAGVAQNRAMDITGHQTVSVFKRYDISNEQDLRDAAEKLARYHVEEQLRGAVPGPFSSEPSDDIDVIQ